MFSFVIAAVLVSYSKVDENFEGGKGGRGGKYYLMSCSIQTPWRIHDFYSRLLFFFVFVFFFFVLFDDDDDAQQKLNICNKAIYCVPPYK